MGESAETRPYPAELTHNWTAPVLLSPGKDLAICHWSPAYKSLAGNLGASMVVNLPIQSSARSANFRPLTARKRSDDETARVFRFVQVTTTLISDIRNLRLLAFAGEKNYDKAIGQVTRKLR